MKALIFVLIVFGVIVAIVGCDPTSPVVTRSDTPISSGLAQSRIGSFVPSSALEVYYLNVSEGLQISRTHFRFVLPTGVNKDLILEELGKNVGSLYEGAPMTLQRSAVSNPSLYKPGKNLQPVHWWKPEAISKGCQLEGGTTSRLILFVDEDSNIIYGYITL